MHTSSDRSVLRLIAPVASRTSTRTSRFIRSRHNIFWLDAPVHMCCSSAQECSKCAVVSHCDVIYHAIVCSVPPWYGMLCQ
eukprot:7224598-Pyramimonas_sp.AAC.1